MQKPRASVARARSRGSWNGDGHPFPLVIDTDRFTLRFWDIAVVWSQGLYSDNAGVAHAGGWADGKRLVFRVDGMAGLRPPMRGGGGVGCAQPYYPRR